MSAVKPKAARSMGGWRFAIGAVFVLLAGCSDLETERQTQTHSSTETVANTANSPTTPESAATDSEVDLLAIIGTAQEGWLPKVVAGLDLTSSTTPAELGNRLPGAQEVSNLGDTDEFTISEVAVEEVPGLEKYQFIFQKDPASGQHDLYSVTLIFEAALKARLSYAQMAKTLAQKYGELEPSTIAKENAFWIGPGFATVSLTNDGTVVEGYKLEVVVPDEEMMNDE